MSVWDSYSKRVTADGATRREISLNREVQSIQNKIQNSLSYFTVTIDELEQNVTIINTDNLNEKYIQSLPGEDIKHGGLVFWMDNYWLVTERDANTTIHTRAKMIQCNYLLKWVSDDGVIHQQWCIIEDGTKYLTGEYEDRNFIVTRGDSRIAMTIAKNKYTTKFNRENRFLIDDPDADSKLAYILSKPLKVGNSFNGDGVFKFVLQEATSTENDNHELGIADYYKHFPKKDIDVENMTNPDVKEDVVDKNGKKGWL